jgi:hypothetical protein
MPSLLRDLRVAPTLLLALSACGPNLADRVARAPAFDRPGETKCGVARSRSEPLVVEWPSAARAELEALSRTGVVAVRYTGCEMEVLASCSAPGKYAYTAITPKRDHVAIRNEDDLYANIPLGAAKLEGKLASSGELDVDMAIVGRYASDRAVVTADQLQGPDCARATHVVSALTVGAFDFSAGSDAAVSGGASVGNAGGGASSSSSRELLNSDGQRTACGTAKTSDASPPEACGAIVRLEVVPLGQAKQEGSVGASAAAAQAVAPPSPSGPGGEVVIDVVEQDQSWMASIEAGGQTFVSRSRDFLQAVPPLGATGRSGPPQGHRYLDVRAGRARPRERAHDLECLAPGPRPGDRNGHPGRLEHGSLGGRPAQRVGAEQQRRQWKQEQLPGAQPRARPHGRHARGDLRAPDGRLSLLDAQRGCMDPALRRGRR